jgi:hypothetical protein
MYTAVDVTSDVATKSVGCMASAKNENGGATSRQPAMMASSAKIGIRPGFGSMK